MEGMEQDRRRLRIMALSALFVTACVAVLAALLQFADTEAERPFYCGSGPVDIIVNHDHACPFGSQELLGNRDTDYWLGGVPCSNRYIRVQEAWCDYPECGGHFLRRAFELDPAIYEESPGGYSRHSHSEPTAAAPTADHAP